MTEQIVHLVQEGLLLALLVSAPPLVASLLMALVTATLQTMTQIQDVTLSAVPRLVVVYGSLVIAGPWIGGQLVRFARAVFETIATVG